MTKKRLIETLTECASVILATRMRTRDISHCEKMDKVAISLWNPGRGHL
jgi:hypothetical protein